MRSLPIRQLISIIIAAIILRLIHWHFYSSTPFFYHPVVDASAFNIWAKSLSIGKVFQNDIFFKPPFYPYLLSWFYRVFGQQLEPVYFLQSIAGVLTAVVTFAVGRIVLPPKGAFGAGMATALLPVLPFLELQLLAESWTTLLSMVSLYLFLTIGSNQKRLILSALLLGLATLGRPNMMILLPLMSWWSWRQFGRRRAVIFAVAFIIAILPATVHNLSHGAFIPVSANLGANLWAGNSPTADGITPIRVGVEWDELQLSCKQSGNGSAKDSNKYLTGKAVKYVFANPAHTAGLFVRKAVILFSGEEPRNNIGIQFLSDELGVKTLHRWWPSTWLLLPFSIVGLVFARSSNSNLKLIALMFTVQAIA
ncbi:hypothetical protein HN388_06940, partial [bacterium]|nr:hypothetical protein [bacterium]